MKMPLTLTVEIIDELFWHTSWVEYVASCKKRFPKNLKIWLIGELVYFIFSLKFGKRNLNRRKMWFAFVLKLKGAIFGIHFYDVILGRPTTDEGKCGWQFEK